jgi:hypothetical protein
MTINFKGFHNTGTIRYGNIKADPDILTNHKIWTQLTDKELKDFGNLADEDNFVRMEIITPATPDGDSFIKVKGDKINTNIITAKNLPILVQAKSMLKQMISPETKLKLDDEYLYSEKAIANTQFPGFNVFEPDDKLEIVDIAHNQDFIKPELEDAHQTITEKLTSILN